MQREIKFRAWNNVFNRFAPDYAEYHFGGENPHLYFDVFNGKFDTEVWDFSECTLMQFTGWKDAGGVEVYESDIMKGSSKSFGAVLGAVKLSSYDDNECYAHEKHLGWNVCGIPLIDLINDGCVVDGNIYENPELLGETK